MNLQPINPPLREGQVVFCLTCGKSGAILADLDGPAFKAFYHLACVPYPPDTCDECSALITYDDEGHSHDWKHRPTCSLWPDPADYPDTQEDSK